MIPGYTTTIDSESCYELQDFFHNTWADFYQLSSLFYNMNPGGASLPDFFVVSQRLGTFPIFLIYGVSYTAAKRACLTHARIFLTPSVLRTPIPAPAQLRPHNNINHIPRIHCHHQNPVKSGVFHLSLSHHPAHAAEQNQADQVIGGEHRHPDRTEHGGNA